MPLRTHLFVTTKTRDTISLFITPIRCDEQHSLLASTSTDYDYESVEETSNDLFSRFLTMRESLQELVVGLEDRDALEKVCTHARRLVEDDETYYETESYQLID